MPKSVYALLNNPIFLSTLFSWFFAQFLKAVIEVLKKNAKSTREMFVVFLWRTGGMPSSHSSAAVSLTTAVGIVEGVGSTIFIVTLFFAFVVIRDALGVRRAAGMQARAINALGKKLTQETGETFQPVKEVNGHTPTEVSVGILLGFFISLAFCSL